MLKCIILLLIIPQIFSNDDQVLSIADHPLFTKIFGLIDQLLIQVRKMQTLINRIHNIMDQMPANLRPYFKECFTVTHNTTSIQYSAELQEAEIIRIPQIRDQLKQATTLVQQLNAMNTTGRIITDVTLNVIKPSLAFVNEILDCFKAKYQLTAGLKE
jgi:hypothetical protein